jgi:3-hydroxyisobutyrate dehydrogenase-like beta-hydroxyacid dehydrogenase
MKIGYIGLGNMGGGMAASILRAKYTMTVNDVRKEAAKPFLDGGASWADTPKAVAESSDIVFTSLPGPKEIEAVALGKDGIIEGIRPGSVYIDTSTSSAQLIRHIYDVFKEKDVQVMDTPITGGSPAQAREGKLILNVGGDEATLQKCKPVLDTIAEKLNYTGGVGTATICKLMQNCIGFVEQMVIGECFTAAVKAGMDPKILWQALKEGNMGEGGIIKFILPATYFRGHFDPPFFSLQLAHKDMNLATSLGREVGVPMCLANLVQQDMMSALNRGWGNRDTGSFMLLQEERAGVEVRIPEEDLK